MLKDVDGGAGDLVIFKGGGEVFDIDNAAACGVDDIGGWFHEFE